MTEEAGDYRNINVDAIVRQVLEQLGAPPAAGAKAAPSGTAAQSQKIARGNGQARPGGELLLSGRVVSVGDLEGRLGNAKAVVVERGAVVTPAAKDLLKTKNVALAFRSSAGGSQKRHALVVGQADTDYEPAELMRALAHEAASIERLAKTGLSGVVREMCEQVSKGGQLGLLFTGKPTVALCLANRHRGVRAATASDARQVGQAVTEVGVNLLIVEPEGRSSFELMKMVGEFLRGGERCCPDNLQAQLG